MIYLKLFLTFLEIGAVSFGGGYGMISLIREKVIANAWLSEGELLNLIAVAESTPGPIAVNMATFVGSSQGGLLGSFCATVGVVLPSFFIILLIAAIIGNVLKFKGVKAFLSGVKPCVVGLILSTGVIMMISKFIGVTSVGDKISPDLFAVVIFIIIFCFDFLYKKLKKEKASPILLILFAAILGAVFYQI